MTMLKITCRTYGAKGNIPGFWYIGVDKNDQQWSFFEEEDFEMTTYRVGQEIKKPAGSQKC